MVGWKKRKQGEGNKGAKGSGRDQGLEGGQLSLRDLSLLFLCISHPQRKQEDSYRGQKAILLNNDQKILEKLCTLVQNLSYHPTSLIMSLNTRELYNPQPITLSLTYKHYIQILPVYRSYNHTVITEKNHHPFKKILEQALL